MDSFITDADWLRQSFLLPKDAIGEQEAVLRTLTSAQFKFTDTTPGGNKAMNPPPQFCRHADVKHFGRQSFSRGQGRVYSENLDDNGQFIHMRFGVATFNSMSNFFFNFYNPKAALLARTGRASSIFFEIGKAVGMIVSLPLAPVVLAGTIVRFFQNKPSSKYYYLKPTMATYWMAVNSIANAIGTNLNLMPHKLTQDEAAITGAEANYTERDLKVYNRLLPDIFNDKGQLDIFALSNRAKRLEMANDRKLQEIMDQATGIADQNRRLRAYLQSPLEDPGGVDYDTYISDYLSLGVAQPGEETTQEVKTGSTEDGEEGETVEYTTYKSDTDQIGNHYEGIDGYANHLKAGMKEGFEWVTFRVDHTGSASESFSNNVGESELAGKLNSMTSGAKSARFSFADGNVDGGLISGVFNAARDLVNGGLAGLQLGGIAALAGSAFADIPKTWQDSSADLPSMNYTIKLRSPYGNDVSRFTNLYVPLAMLLASALPLSTGRQSYYSPFLCQCFDQGRAQTRLGMVTSMSIERGTGNTGWTQDHKPLGIDVSFTVTDMSTVMHMPLKPSVSSLDYVATWVSGAVGGAAAKTFENDGFTNVSKEEGSDIGELVALAAQRTTYDDDNAFSDYMAVLGNLSFKQQTYGLQRWKVRMQQRLNEFESLKSPAQFAQMTADFSPVRYIRGTGILL